MKKTYTISLGGRIFPLEEDAGNKLQAYIQTLENYYFKEEGGQEIMNDIEGRIAELLNEYMQAPAKEVITLADIERIISIMGNPDDIINEDHQEDYTKKQDRKLYRDNENKMIGGVAAGIATYLNVSVVLIRILFAILAIFYGITILVYIILWIAVPVAFTAKQKLEMKGEPINISNIEKNIRNNIDEIKNGKLQDFLQKITGIISAIAQGLGKVILKTGEILLKIVSGIILVVTVIILLSFVFSFFSICGTPWNLHAFGLSVFMTGASAILVKISIFLIVLCPLFLLTWLTSRFLFNFKNRYTIIPFTLLVLWITGIAIAIYIGLSQMGNFSEHSKDASVTPITVSPNKCLVVKINPRYSKWGNYSIMGIRYSGTPQDQTIYMSPNIKFAVSQKQTPEVSVIKEAHGFSPEDALQNTQSVDFNWSYKNDTLWIDNNFKINRLWRANKLNMTIWLPEDQKIYLDSSFDNGNVTGYRSPWQADGYFKIGPNGLEPIEKIQE